MNYLCQRHIIGDKRRNQRFFKMVEALGIIIDRLPKEGTHKMES